MIPKVTVLMTAFNAEAAVKRAIFSVLNQDYKNLELIIIDDNSTDNTLSLLKKCKTLDKRIRIISSSENYGTYTCKNYGIRISTGDYFIVHDSDDHTSPYYISKTLEPLLKDKKVSYTGLYKVEDGKYLHQNIVSLHSTCFHREAIEKIGYYDAVRFSGDFEYSLRLNHYYGQDLISENNIDAYYYYEKRDNSLTTAEKTKVGSDARIDYMNKCRNFYDNKGKHVFLYVDFPIKKRLFQIDPNSPINIGKPVDLSSFKEL